MSSADMMPPSLPVAPDTPEASGNSDVPGTGNRTRRRWYWGIGLLLLVGVVLGAAFVPTPYVLIQPGAVRSAEERVIVEGTESFPNDASVLFTTVFVDDATLFGLLRGAWMTQSRCAAPKRCTATAGVTRHDA